MAISSPVPMETYVCSRGDELAVALAEIEASCTERGIAFSFVPAPANSTVFLMEGVRERAIISPHRWRLNHGLN